MALITEVERYRFLLGKEGVIVGRGEQLGYPTDDAWVVDIPGCVGEITELCGRTEWNLHASELAPLTDPGADAFIERIKKLKPYEEPKVPARNPEYSGRTES